MDRFRTATDSFRDDCEAFAEIDELPAIVGVMLMFMDVFEWLTAMRGRGPS